MRGKTKRKGIYIGVSILVVIFLFSGIAIKPVSAQEKSWYFEEWQVDIEINQDSSFIVREKQAFNFTGNYHWVTRTIPKDGLRDITDIKVFDEQGSQLTNKEIEISDNGYDVVIRINFDLTDTSQTWTFQYKVYGGLGEFLEHDELYWNAISSDREVLIEKVGVTVKLPEEVDIEEMQQTMYYGYYGAKNTLETYEIIDAQTFYYTATDVEPSYNLTIVAGWPKGIIEFPLTVWVNTEPEGAEVFIDVDEMPYVTPSEFFRGEDFSKAEQNTVVIKKTGYHQHEEIISFSDGSNVEINVTLEQTWWYAALKTIAIILIILYFISPLFLLIYLVKKWRRSGKDIGGRGTIIPQYEPPDSLKPSVVGVLVDERAHMKDVTSIIIDLAVRGYLQIIEKEKSRGNKYHLKKLKDFHNKPDIDEYERIILKGIFRGNREEASLSQLSTKFYAKLNKVKRLLYKEVVQKGYFTANPDKVRVKYKTLSIVLVVIGFMGLLFYGLGLPIMISGIILLIFGHLMPQKTAKGTAAKEHALGFRMYLHKAERFRIGKMTPETFERFLPYAMVLGVEKEWAERFSDIYTEPPQWYSGYSYGAFSVTHFTNNLSTSFSSKLSSTMSSRPSSSGSGFSGGSSGFSGGGFSGGGGGGGGSSAG